MPEMTTVDKRTFLTGTSCRTQAWYLHRAAEEPPSPGLAWRFHAGLDIGARAREWLGPGQMLPRTPRDAAVEATRRALEAPTTTLVFEASFVWGNLAARADALRRTSDGCWELIEIKSGTSPKDGDTVSDDYIDDIAYTLCIAAAAGLTVTRALIVLINRDYRLGGTSSVLVTIDVTDPALSRAAAFRAIAEDLSATVIGTERPAPALQFACKDCDYFATDCVGAGVPDPLFMLPYLQRKKFGELQTYERISKLPPAVKLSEHQQRVAHVIRTGEPHHDMDGLRLLDEVVWPAYYLDFEAVSPHLPWFDTCPPYDATPFQYSLHIRASFDIPETHRAYLAPAEGDWRRELVTQLLADLGAEGSIVVYSSYERTQLKAMAARFPEFAEAIGLVIPRLFDLEAVVKRGYVHPGFAGRTSIKKVLPALIPELSYSGLHVGNGEDAAAVFGLMRVGQTPDDEHPALREALLAYCRLDTLAMLRLHTVLWNLRHAQPAS